MSVDKVLGQPIRLLLKPAVALLPFALIGLVSARFLPPRFFDAVWVSSFLICGACLVLFTPYLMLAGGCFYAMSQLPFPNSLSVSAWGWHVALLSGVAFCLWRTWTLWPTGLKKQEALPVGVSPAPWWGYALGAVAIFGLFGLMIYVFHFQT